MELGVGEGVSVRSWRNQEKVFVRNDVTGVKSELCR